MPMKVHENLKAAQKALDEYSSKLEKLQEEYGAFDDHEDDCARVFLRTKYYAPDKKTIKTLTY